MYLTKFLFKKFLKMFYVTFISKSLQDMILKWVYFMVFILIDTNTAKYLSV